MADKYSLGGKSDDSPWSGDVPVREAPIEFDFATAQSPPSSPPPPPTAFGEHGRPLAADHGGRLDSDGSPQRRGWMIALGVAAAVVAGALVVNATRDSSDGEAELAAPDTSLVEDEPEPAVDSTLPGIDEDDLEPDDDESDGDEVDEVDPTDGVPAPGTVLAGVWTDSTIEVPEPLRSMTEPSVVVAVDVDRTLHEISLPSGAVRSIEIPDLPSDYQFVVGSRATLLSGFNGQTFLVPSDGSPIEIEFPNNAGFGDQFRARPGSDEFLGYVYDNGLAGVRELIVGPDGTLTERGLPGDQTVPYFTQLSPTGTTLITDAGGVYELRDDGTSERISDGTLLSVSSHHLVLRTCDANRSCQFVIREGVAGTDLPVSDHDGFTNINAFSGNIAVQVSPDGASMRMVEFTASGAVARIVDTETGTDFAIPLSDINAFQNPSFVWTADSSGIIDSAQRALEGLLFTDRITGDVTNFATELGRIRQAGVRLGAAATGEVAPAPTSSGLRLVGYGIEGVLYDIDVDAAQTTSLDVPPIESAAPVYLIVDDSGVTAASYDNVDGFRLDAADGSVRPVDSELFGGALVAGPRAGSVWRKVPNIAAGSDFVYTLVDALGAEAGETITIPNVDDELATEFDSDGSGGLLVPSEFGGVYSFDGQGVDQITTGEVIALGSTVGFVRECDVEFRCGVFRVDRETGERIGLDEPGEFATTGRDDARLLGQRVSPDGEVVFLPPQVRSGSWTAVDLASGNSFSVSRPDDDSAIVWSDDGQYAVYLSDAVLHLYDRAASAIRTLNWVPDLEVFARAPTGLDAATPEA